MATQPHPDPAARAVTCATLTVSDTRTSDTDRSGQLIQTALKTAGHRVAAYEILPDEPATIRATVLDWCANPGVEAIVLNGGTGIAPRDTTYDAIAALLDKTLPGFGELFRYLSYGEVGSRAMASRAIAGIHQNTLIFSLPGSSNAVRLGMEALILPELGHLVRQMQGH
ncbi:MAG: MogA/MoaB family molybdenum cofactor biosynthesis protein [Cyanobacteria bacterium]|nr:MogA/MoaB family molybdenum cofactor biosynthesis protein [Cyanobacteriota bacterium]